MKILTIVYSLEQGGTQRAAQTFCEAYSNLGHDSRILALYEGGQRAVALASKGIRVDIGLSETFIKDLQQWAPDLIHLHSHAILGNDIVRVVSSCPEAIYVETNVFSQLSDYPDDILTHSFQLSEWCNYLYLSRGGKKEKSLIVPNPVDINCFKRSTIERRNDFRKKYNIGGDTFLLGKIGQSFGGKWSKFLVDTLEMFVKSVSNNVRLILVNPSEQILNYVVKKQMYDYVIHIDRIVGDDALCDCYSSIDIFVHASSQGESFGYVFTESLLCETPVVVLNTPWSDNSQSEIVGDSVGGFCVNNKEEMFAAIRNLYSDEKLRKQLGKKGRDRIISTYDSIKVARNALDYVSSRKVGSGKISLSSLEALATFNKVDKKIMVFVLWLKLKFRFSHRGANYFLKKYLGFEFHF